MIVRRVLTAGVALAAILALFAVPAVAAPSPTAGTVPPRAALFGDSISWQARTEYMKSYGGTTLTDYRAVIGWSMHDWQFAILAKARVAAPSTPFILALGSNDAVWSSWGVDVLAFWRSTLDVLVRRVECVVVPEFGARGHGTNAQARGAFWPKLERLLLSYADRGVHIARWATTADQHPEWYAADGVHHTETGSRAYAFSLWLSLGECTK